MARWRYHSVKIFKKKGGTTLDAWVAQGSKRRTGIEIDKALGPKAREMASRARANLAATRSGDETYGKHSHIEVTKGWVDWYVTLSVTSGSPTKSGANPALSVEFGRGSYTLRRNGRSYNVSGFRGLFILGRAAAAMGYQTPGRR